MRGDAISKTVSANEVEKMLGVVANWVIEHQDEVIVEKEGAPTIVIMAYSEYEKLKVGLRLEDRSLALKRLRALREAVRARNTDITTDEQADALADRFVRDVIDDMVQEGKILFEN